jgi:hypothetical protein
MERRFLWVFWHVIYPESLFNYEVGKGGIASLAGWLDWWMSKRIDYWQGITIERGTSRALSERALSRCIFHFCILLAGRGTSTRLQYTIAKHICCNVKYVAGKGGIDDIWIFPPITEEWGMLKWFMKIFMFIYLLPRLWDMLNHLF